MILFKIAFVLHLYYGVTSAKGVPSMDQAIEAAAQKSEDLSMMQADNSILVELDMRFTQDQWAAIQALRNAKSKRSAISKRNALKNIQMRWTRGIVPINIGGGFSGKDMQQINAGISEWNKFTCVNIRRATGSDRNYVQFVPSGGCSSYVGMVGNGRQVLTLGPGCRYKGIVAHELGHALGFHHEQTRPDRDRYVRILTRNIRPYAKFNFKKYTWGTINAYGVPYDYGSIMHYGTYAFSRNGQMTIQTINPSAQKKIGNRYGISFYDMKLINLMYNCASKCGRKTCPGDGFVGKDCRCWCKGPNSKTPAIDCITKRPIAGGNTQGPRPTVKPKPTVTGRGKIRDFHPSCSKWARSGECRRNPGWMLVNCKYSCRKVGVTKPQRSCKDKNRWCSQWARANYCRSSTFNKYMSLNCRKSCNLCSQSGSRASSPSRSQSQARINPYLRDYNGMCPYWARRGECTRNPRYMGTYCRRSCQRG